MTLTIAVAVLLVSLVAWRATSGGSSGPASGFAKPSGGGAQPTANNTDLSVQFQGAGGVSIGAELLLPPGSNAHTPGVVIVPDDGATNRNGFAPTNAVSDPLYADLAQALAADGIASLRYDRRGQGQSVLPSAKAVTLPDVTGDARAAVTFLAGRADVDHSRLAVIGDGQGGLVALQVAAADPAVRAVVLVSTPGRPVLDSMVQQLQAIAPTPAMGQQLVAQLQATVAALEAGHPEPSQAQLPAPIQPLLPPGEGPYLKSIFALNPPALAAGVHVPTLVVQGGADPALSPADSQALLAALGPHATALSPAQDGATLLAPVPVPATSATTTTMQNVHHGGPVSTQRDYATLSAIARWVKSNAG
ncbi:MAG: alpha/beta hydrolase [Acidimicrobiales bacterium]